MIDTRELAWAAGLFEGEGHASVIHRKTDAPHNLAGSRHIVVKLNMTDEDSLRRFHAAVGFGRVNGPYEPPSPRKPYWAYAVEGFEKTQAIAALLWFGLGERRKQQFRDALTEMRYVQHMRDPKTGRFTTLGAYG